VRNCVVVILAAGLSSRFPGKLVAELWGRPLVWWAAEAARRSAVGPVYIVVHDRDVAKAAGQVAGAIYNPWRLHGLSTSVKAALTALIHVERIVFLPGDMPLVKPDTIKKVCGVDTRGLAVAVYKGVRGNPVALAKDAYAAALKLEGDVGLRALIERVETRYVEVDDPGVHIDVDTPQMLRRLSEQRPAMFI
jgi:molybdenum cofactor cytidylyltransferase